MSIKIIKNTMVEPETTTCPLCKSVLSYTFEDIQREDQFNIFCQKTGVKRYIVCPVCKSDINLSPRVVLKNEEGNK